MGTYPTKILAATDGSEVSKLTIRHAAELAEKTGSELHVVQVGPVSHWLLPLAPEEYRKLEGETRKRLDEEVKEAEAAGAKVTKAHLRMGRVDAEVIKLCEELGAGLIVIGNRGMGAVARIRLGNDAESIVRHAPCPVMLVRKPE